MSNKFTRFRNKIRDSEDLLDSAVNELRFANMQNSHLLSVIHELEEIGDNLTKGVIKNGIERHNLDKLIHARLLFKNKNYE